MDLSDIASIAGKGGLFRVVSPSRNGVVVESLDGQNKRFVAGMNQQVSVLEEISIYTHTTEGSTPLADIFLKMKEEFGDDLGVDNKSTADELKAFLKHILPQFDEDKVYPSDIKKLVSWYKILLNKFPERFVAEEEKKEEPKEEEKKEAAPKPKKATTAKKKPAASSKAKPKEDK